MPVLDASGDDDDRARLKGDGVFAPLLVPALARGADEHLAATLVSGVDVPVVAAARLEGDVYEIHPRLACARKRVEVAVPNKEPGKFAVEHSGAKNIDLVELLLVCNLHVHRNLIGHRRIQRPAQGSRKHDDGNVEKLPGEREGARSVPLSYQGRMYSYQDSYEQQLRQLGILDDDAYTFTCYLDQVGNRPQKGDVLSWAESSAVIYASSSMTRGARGGRCKCLQS